MTTTDLVLPSAADLARFIESLIALPWPRSDAEQEAFFGRLGLVEVRPDPPNVDEISVGGWVRVAALSPSQIGWTAYQSELIGLSVFVYDSHFLTKEKSRRAFELLRDRLKVTFGAADEEDPDTATSSACFWIREGFLVELYFARQKGRSIVQLGIGCVDRNAVYEAAVVAHAGLTGT